MARHVWLMLLAVGVVLGLSSAALAGNFKYHIKNESQTAIIIVMDTNREEHKVEAGATVIFEKANIGDNPTFHVWQLNDKGDKAKEIFADTFNTVRLLKSPTDRDLKWTGSKLDDK